MSRSAPEGSAARRSPARPALLWALRLLGAGLLAAIGVIHGYLWAQGYRTIEVIGPAFLLDTILGGLTALLVLLVPLRLLAWAALAGGTLAAGTLGALLLTTYVGLFGFVESMKAQLWWESAVVEAAAVVVLAALGALTVASRRQVR